MKIDRASLLVDVDGASTLGACEDALAKEGLTLGLDPIDRDVTIAQWIARGTPGARDAWEDPSDHVLAGLEATLPDGRLLTIRPCPRRAVGPDLVALVHGMRDRFARVTRAWVRVHAKSEPRSRPHPLKWDRDPEMTSAEAALFDAIERAMRG